MPSGVRGRPVNMPMQRDQPGRFPLGLFQAGQDQDISRADFLARLRDGM
jgi:hypothetical protein